MSTASRFNSLIVAGSRTYTDVWRVRDNIARYLRYNKVDMIVSGGARGPDTYAIDYAEEHSIPYVVFNAEWDKYGRGAGHRRNMEMAIQATELLAFWDGRSAGTKNMIQWMQKLNKPCTIVL